MKKLALVAVLGLTSTLMVGCGSLDGTHYSSGKDTWSARSTDGSLNQVRYEQTYSPSFGQAFKYTDEVGEHGNRNQQHIKLEDGREFTIFRPAADLPELPEATK